MTALDFGSTFGKDQENKGKKKKSLFVISNDGAKEFEKTFDRIVSATWEHSQVLVCLSWSVSWQLSTLQLTLNSKEGRCVQPIQISNSQEHIRCTDHKL
jgi:hypothetical protein